MGEPKMIRQMVLDAIKREIDDMSDFLKESIPKLIDREIDWDNEIRYYDYNEVERILNSSVKIRIQKIAGLVDAGELSEQCHKHGHQLVEVMACQYIIQNWQND